MLKSMSSSRTQQSVGLKYGFRSGLEGDIAKQLERGGTPVIFEELVIPWEEHKFRKYTPDFLLPNGIIIESKGRFVTADRQKHLAIKKQYPALDIRFVFSRSASRISKTSKTTYAKWCSTKGFQFADKAIPGPWLAEPPEEGRIEAVRALFTDAGKACPI